MIRHNTGIGNQANPRQIAIFGVSVYIPPHHAQKHAVQHDFEKPRNIIAEHPPTYRVALYLDAKLTHPIEGEQIVEDVEYVG